MSRLQRPRIGLALGSGVGRGWAHLGVIKALSKLGVTPDIVCGTSIGALIAGFYVVGHLDCQRRRKKGPPRRRKKGPLGGCELVPVVHGRDLWAHGVKRGHGGRFTRRLGLDAGGFD